jgi:hypothetical protein
MFVREESPFRNLPVDEVPCAPLGGNGTPIDGRLSGGAQGASPPLHLRVWWVVARP